MTWKPSNPEPSPEQWAAWADGELNSPDAEKVERWLRAHPEAARDAEESARLINLYRDHPPPEPTERAWQAALSRIESDLTQPRSPSRRPGPRGRLRLWLALTAAAAVLGGLSLARAFWPAPADRPLPEVAVKQAVTPEEGEDPFPVAAANEVNILSITVEDADRVVLVGPPLMGAFEWAAPNDIDVVGMEPSVADGQKPRLHRGQEAPMILVASADREDP